MRHALTEKIEDLVAALLLPLVGHTLRIPAISAHPRLLAVFRLVRSQDRSRLAGQRRNLGLVYLRHRRRVLFQVPIVRWGCTSQRHELAREWRRRQFHGCVLTIPWQEVPR